MILTIDTSNLLASAALIKNGQVIDFIINDKPSQQSKMLFGLIDELLLRNNSNYKDLTAIVTSAGPGSFTGIRIGLSASAGIAIGLKIPHYGIDNFSCYAAENNNKSQFTLLIDAGKNEFYGANIANGKILGEPFIVNAENISEYPHAIISSFNENSSITAKSLAIAYINGLNVKDPEPFYIKPANITKPKVRSNG